MTVDGQDDEKRGCFSISVFRNRIRYKKGRGGSLTHSRSPKACSGAAAGTCERSAEPYEYYSSDSEVFAHKTANGVLMQN